MLPSLKATGFATLGASRSSLEGPSFLSARDLMKWPAIRIAARERRTRGVVTRFMSQLRSAGSVERWLHTAREALSFYTGNGCSGSLPPFVGGGSVTLGTQGDHL